MSVVTYAFPTTIRFGAGARRQLADGLRAQGVSRPIVVTDEGVSKLPFTAEIVAHLREAGLDAAVFDGVVGNPVESQVTAGTAALKAHDADSIVALGGGAATDVARAVALMAHHPGDLFDYEDEMPGARPIDQAIPYFVAIPTTAGTGSEVGRSAVISTDDTHVKKILFSPRLLPSEVFADPELLLGLPAHITAATGLDALTHNIEAYLAKMSHPICEGIALEGIRLVERSLRACVRFAREGAGATDAHIAARGDMLNASMMGSIAFQKGLGVTHSCAHALSTVCDMHHGLANGVMLHASMAFNLEAVPAHFDVMAQVVGVEGGPAFLEWIRALNADCGIPASLPEAGVDAKHFDALVDVAVDDPVHGNNPRPCGRADFERIFRAAFGG